MGREFVLTLRSVIWIDVIDLFLIISALFVAAKARAGRTVLCQYFAIAWRFGFRFVWPTVCPVVLSAVWQLSQWQTSGPHRHPLRYLIVLDFSRLSAVKEIITTQKIVNEGRGNDVLVVQLHFIILEHNFFFK